MNFSKLLGGILLLTNWAGLFAADNRTVVFDWQRSKIDFPEVVLKPWTPVKVEGQTVRAWGRAYTLNRLGLPEKILTQSQCLLAGPWRLECNGQPIKPSPEELKWGEQSDARVSVTGRGRCQAAAFTLQTRIEYDGLARTKLTISPTKSANVASLTLVIPLKKEFARYLNLTEGAWDNGQQPWHPGLLNRFLIDHRWTSAFLPVLWLGDENVGFSWCAESMAGWQTAGNGTEIEIVDQADAVEMKIHFVQPQAKSIATDQPWSMEFGWLATPPRPMPDGWQNWQFINEVNADQRSRKQGNITILWHALWSEALGSPRPRDPALLTRLVQNAHRDGYKAIIYIALTDTMASIASEGDAWKKIEHKPIPEVSALEGTWSHAPCREKHWGIRTCPRSSWVDFLLHFIDEDIKKYDIDGIYFDNTPLVRCNRAEHGCGFIAADGTRKVTNGLFAQREFFKRVNALFQRRGKMPVIMVHSSMAMQIPDFAFVQATFDGEQFNNAWQSPYHFDRLVPLDLWRTHYLGRQWGLAPVFLPSPEFRTVSDCREHLAYTLIHDTLLFAGWLAPGPLEAVWRTRQAFGLGNDPSVEFAGYWQEGSPITASNEAIKVSFWTAKHKTMAAASNLGHADLPAVVLKVDAQQVGKIENVKDALTGQSIACRDNQITLPLKKKDFSLLTWENKRPIAPAGKHKSLSASASAPAVSEAAFADRSGRNHSIRICSSAQTVPGKIRSALEFLPGNGGYAIVAPSDHLNVRNQLTVEAWINLRGTANTIQRLVAKEAATDPVQNPNGFRGYHVSVTAQNEVQFYLTLNDASILLSTPIGAIQPKTWTHVACVYDGKAMRIYINGKPAAEQPASGTILATPGLLVIGNTNCAFRQSLEGRLDELYIWSQSRTADEIRQDMTTRPKTGDPGLIGCWSFE